MKVLSKWLLNNKILIKNISGVVLLKGASLILTFIMTPMYLAYFKDQGILGVWYTLQSILVWILTFDLGVGNGIRNRLASAIAKNDHEQEKRIVSSGYIVFGIMTILVVLLLAIIIPFINWQRALNSNMHIDTLNRALFITLVGIVLQFLFKIVTSILMALRKNILANSLAIITNSLIMFYLLIPINVSDETKFELLAIVYTLATILPLFSVTLYIFEVPLKNIHPSIKAWDRNIGKEVLRVGSAFFVIQLGLLVVNSTNQFLINFLFGGVAVVDYTLYYRLYSTATMIFTLFTQPIWSEVSIRYAKGDTFWVRKIYHLMLFLAVLISVGCLVVTGGLPLVFKIWLGDGTQASRWIGLVFFTWSTVEVFIYAGTCIANGMTKLNCQILFTIGAAVTKIPVTFLCARIFPNWLSVVIAHIVILIPLMIAQNIMLSRQLRKSVCT